MSTEKDLNYWKANAEEDYKQVPISVLRYITELETAVKNCSIPDVSESKLTMHQLNCKTWMVKCEMGDILTEGTKQECDDFVRGWLEAERSGI